MILDSIRARVLAIPFKRSFKHASAERAASQSLWVEARARDGTPGYGEGCPREYVSAETPASAETFVARHGPDWLATIRDLGTLADWAARHRADIDRNPSAWSAVELALLDLFGQAQGKSIEALLGLPELPGRFRYSAVLGDAAPRRFEAELDRYLEAGFRDFKIKLSGEAGRDLAKVRALHAAGIEGPSVRADANNLWREASAAIRHLRALGFWFWALEEPLRAGDFGGMQELARALSTRVILDESCLRGGQLERLADHAEHWIVNLRVSKMGGLMRSLDLVREAGGQGLSVIVGAHVGETSVLTRAGLTVAHAARAILLAQEGAFGTHLLAHDVVDPSLVFGTGGMLDVAALEVAAKPGFGLAMSPPNAAISGVVRA